MTNVRRSLALITGASSGIGYDLALVMAEQKHDLVLVARRADKLNALATEIAQRHGVAVSVIVKDLAKTNAAQELVDELNAQQLQVDVLVNNAGFSSHGAVTEIGVEQMQAMVQVNVLALIELTRLIAPQMAARRTGRILNVASVVSFTPAPFAAVYAATKAFVLSFSEAMSEELDGTGVTVTALCPGTTETEFAATAGMSNTNAFRGKGMPSREVAEIGYRAMMQGKPVVIAGWKNRFSVFGMRLTPRRVVAKIAKAVMKPAK